MSTPADTGARPFDTDLTGRTAMVTGAASGIGAACAVRLAAAGAHVIAVDRDEAGLAELAAGTDIAAPRATCPTSTPSAALPAAVDILVNNAGIQHVAPIQDFPPERFDLILRLMLQSPFRLVRAVLPHMYDAGWGRVVNVSSAHGLRASPFKSAYVTAKHGLEGLSKVIALEGADARRHQQLRQPGLRAHAAGGEADRRPGRRRHGIPESEVLEKVLLEPVAVKRLIEPAEVADLVAFLCGPSSASISGSSFAMDGGWTAS